jgi:hypothetical protein
MIEIEETAMTDEQAAEIAKVGAELLHEGVARLKVQGVSEQHLLSAMFIAMAGAIAMYPPEEIVMDSIIDGVEISRIFWELRDGKVHFVPLSANEAVRTKQN